MWYYQYSSMNKCIHVTLLRYEFCPIFINEKMRKKQSNVSEKVWNHQNNVNGKGKFMGKRNVKKNVKQREKWEKKEKIWTWRYQIYCKCIDSSWLWHVYEWYLGYNGSHGLYSAYNRYIVVSAQPMTGILWVVLGPQWVHCGWYLAYDGISWVYSAYNGNCGWYLPYDGELLAVLFAQMCYMVGTHGYKELHGY